MIPGSATPLLLAKSGEDKYKIYRSLRFNSGDSAYLNRTPSSAGNRKTWTWSGWVKLTKPSSTLRLLSAGTAATQISEIYYTSDQLRIFHYPGSISIEVITAQVFRDFSAWHHVVVAVDTTQSTASNRVRLYVNGSEVDSFSTATYPSQNTDTFVNGANAHYISATTGDNNAPQSLYYGDGYLADVHFIDGQALAPTDFGEYDDNNVWQPKEYTGEYGPLVDQSQTWSTYGSYTGSTSNSSGTGWESAFDASGTTYTWSSAGSDFTFTSAIPYTQKVEIWGYKFNSSDEIRVNASDVAGFNIGSTDASLGWVTALSGSGNLTSIGSTGFGLVAQVRVDGKLLIDAGISVVNNGFHLDFSDNSSNAALGYDAAGSNDWTVNNIQTGSNPVYSDNLTTNGGTSWFGGAAVNAFDGATNTFVQGALGQDVTFAPAASIPVTTSLKIWADSGSGSGVGNGPYQIIYNGTTIYNGTMWTSPYTITAAVGTSLSTLVIDTTPTGEAMRLFAIEVDGTILVNGAGAGEDSLIDTPTNYEAAVGNAGGNYCTWNPVQPTFATTSFSNGNLDSSLQFTNGAATPYAVGTLTVSSGKWYWEITLTQESNDTEYIGFIDGSKSGGAWAFADIGAYFSDARKAVGTTPSSYGATYTTGDVIGVALDADNGSLTFYKNGTSQGVAATGMTFDSYKPFTSANGTTTAQLVSANFGQRPFAYTPPTGYKSLCTTNLPDPTIADGSTAMDVALYTGNGSTQTISGLEFSPDLVWLKRRNVAGSHQLYDVVRGTTKAIFSDQTAAEGTYTNGLTSFDSNGFSIGNLGGINTANNTHVAWTWDAGDATTTIASGGLNSSVYDQSQTWSNGAQSGNAPWGSSSWDYVFNGVIPSTFDHSNLVYQVASGGVFTFSSAISGRIQVYSALGSSGYYSGNTIVLSDGTSQEVTNGNSSFVLYDFGVKSNITSITLNGAGNTSGLGVPGILLDGKLLVDSGVTVANVPTIASTVRANPSAGFSIATFTMVSSGTATVGHGLNVSPSLIIAKARTGGASNWNVFHSAVCSKDNYLYLNSTNALGTFTDIWGTAAPSSSVFGVSVNLIPASQDIVAYCFAPVEGYSAFGSYTGNGSADGPFVYTGFRPRFIMTKSTSNVNDWYMYDTSRNTYNESTKILSANQSTAENDFDNAGIDILSNGFKLKADPGGYSNFNGWNYVYIAFAENPFKTARAR